jgi:hypothetical protein
VTPSPHADAARELLLARADRAVTGLLDDPAEVAAVVGVERLVVVTGSTDVEVLRAAVDATDGDLGEVAAEARASVAEGLERRAVGEAVDAGVVNPDAGRHEITGDATLLRAGVRASQRSFDATPYYRMRYGGRGARFASTDTAWLISLAEHEEDQAVRQVRWLSRVLATRGMPSWLLETHLGELVGELREAGGDEAAGQLPAARHALAAARREHVDDDLLGRAETWLSEALDADLPFRGAGTLLAAAVADELSGVARDDRAYVGWLTYPERLHPDAAAAVLDVGGRIRAAAG